MKISLAWLNEFVDIQDHLAKPQALADVLTFAGLEVESIENLTQKYNQIVTGLILKKEAHPEADKLSVCQVTTGQGVVHQIVCGAKNHKENDRVVVALPGAKLPGGLEIKEATLRNVPSKGMLCSASELGLSEDGGGGIIILPGDAPIGESFAKYQGLEDTVFELKVTPNRADCLSHLGLARELACLLDRPLKMAGGVTLAPEPQGKHTFSLEVESPEACPVYFGAKLSNVKVGPSPAWLQQRLAKLGMNSINNVVDVTNYVMLERGQPFHAFDASKITGNQVRVRLSKKGEKFTSLDGTSYTLPDGEIVIASSEGILALAGVVGGKDSGVTEQTQDIFLEAAVFEPSHIRRASRRLGVQTDSGYRFSRGVDAFGVKEHLLRVTALLAEISGAKLEGEILHHSSIGKDQRTISLTPTFVGQKLGYSVSGDDFSKAMQKLGCQVVSGEEGVFEVKPPTWRFDLEQDVDLVEEYGRLHGYDKIPETLPSQNVMPTPHQTEYLKLRHIAKRAASQGFYEAVLPFLTAVKHETAFIGEQTSLEHCGFTSGSVITLKNPLSEDHSSLKRTLALGLSEVALYNLRQGQKVGQIFELGTVAVQNEQEAKFKESYHFGAMAWGESEQVWDKTQKAPFILQFREKILSQWSPWGLSLTKPQDRSLLPAFLHRGQSAWLQLGDQVVGYLGSLHPSWLDEHKVRVPMAICEINLQALLKKGNPPHQFEAFSRFPAVERDLALVVPRNLPANSLELCFFKSLNKYLQRVELFDIYEGEKLPAGHKQLGYRLTLQSKEGTLAEAEVGQLMQDLLLSLKNDLGVHLREA